MTTMASKAAFTGLVLLIFSLGLVNASGGTRECPAYCKCDLFENLNRADCSGQRLIDPNVEVPDAVEFLDLSYNDITTLNNDCFENLIFITNLTVAHNALHTIYLDAFSPLKNLKSVDLSQNRLEYFDDRIFETNTKLIKVDFSMNKFMSLTNKPLLKSTSIQILDLHDAQITYIYRLMFSEMLSLREIDLSGNFMITITTTAFNYLSQLEELNLNDNRWICDKNFDTAIQFFKSRNIEIKLDTCKSRTVPHMFERMMIAPPLDRVEKKPSSIENIWKPKKVDSSFDLDKILSCPEHDSDTLCQLYHTCMLHMKLLYKDKVSKSTYPARHKYSEHDLEFVFVMGLVFGLISSATVVTCWIFVRACCSMRRRLSPMNNARNEYRTNHRRTVNRPSTLTEGGQLVENNDFASFISRLFDRPSRHQYYRNINQNTAHMIRRLSQSSLFNNRLSHHINGTRNANRQSGQQEEPLIHQRATENAFHTNQDHTGAEEGWQSVYDQVGQDNGGDAIASQHCPETPPPSYREVIGPK